MFRSLVRFAPLAVLLAACTIEKAPAQNPQPAGAEPAPTAKGPSAVGVDYLSCPIGKWKVGETEVKISSNPGKPGVYDVTYNGKQVGNPGSVDGQNFKVDMGQATGGQYNCAMQPDCNSMSCGFAGQPPQVFKKLP
ncbi:MAG: hypothetical protein IPJ34_37065 [Myxococcales bacterium]|nr:hypothetical protein [Myxococcales bacterium]